MAPATIPFTDFDLLVGAPNPGGAGRAHWFRLGTNPSLLGSITGGPDGFGSSIAGLLDLDADGFADDVAIGSPEANGGRGRIDFFRGQGFDPQGSIDGLAFGGRFGAALANVGSIDEDNVPDLLVGVPGVGQAQVLSLPSGDLRQVFAGAVGFGSSVAAAGDIAGDDRQEVLIGSPNDTADTGAAVVNFAVNLGSGAVTNVGPGCAAGGITPRLDVVGCVEPGQTIFLHLDDGAPFGTALLLLGAGDGAIPFFPGCSLNLAPLSPVFLPVLLDGNGSTSIPADLPNTLPPGSVFLQAPVDPIFSNQIAVSNAIRIDIP